MALVGQAIAALFWAGLLLAFLAGLRFTRRQQAEQRLEEGRRRYPCSHGAAPRPRN